MAEFHNNISILTTPTAPKHAVNVDWVVNYIMGKLKDPVRLVATTPLAGTYADGIFTLATTGVLVVDGKAVDAGDRILVMGQTGPEGPVNGIYVVEDPGDPSTEAVLVRAEDFNKSELISTGVRISVTDGLSYAGRTFALETAGTIILDSTALVFYEVPDAVGVSKFVGAITGNNTDDEFVVQHDLNSNDVVVHFWNTANSEVAYIDYAADGPNAIRVKFDEAPPSTLSFKVIVMA